jgi:hypothetical protein
LKRLTIKEFDHFTDRRVLMDENVEPLFAKALIGMRGQTWKGKKIQKKSLFDKTNFNCRHAINIVANIYR